MSLLCAQIKENAQYSLTTTNLTHSMSYSCKVGGMSVLSMEIMCLLVIQFSSKENRTFNVRDHEVTLSWCLYLDSVIWFAWMMNTVICIYTWLPKFCFYRVNLYKAKVTPAWSTQSLPMMDSSLGCRGYLMEEMRANTLPDLLSSFSMAFFVHPPTGSLILSMKALHLF